MYKFLFVAVTAVAIGCVNAIKEQDKQAIRTIIRPYLRKCAQETGVSSEEIKQAEADNTFQNLDSCFLACLYRDTGVLTDDNKLDTDAAVSVIGQYFSGDEYYTLTSLVKSCEKANNPPVSYSNAACDRSRLIANCLFSSKSA